VNYDYEDYSDGVSDGGPQDGKFQSRPSYAGAASVGYGFGNGFRAEIGFNYYRNTVHRSDVEAQPYFENEAYISPAFGGENTYGPMVNALYDFSVGLPVFPYVGAGVGYQWYQLSRKINDVESFDDTVSGTEGSFAYQLIGGLSYPLPMMPQLSLTAEYRFMQLTESRKYTAIDVDPYYYDGPNKLGQVSSNTFMFGLRYSLFTPPVMAPATPAPMASPAPAAAKTYLVFFDWDKYSLTPRADAIIAEAASDSKTSAVTTIDVSGYTDTSGTPTYNQGLSERRAKAVAAKLVADGVAASEISIHAYGETHLLVPTGPGVREPQNRRVEIVLD